MAGNTLSKYTFSMYYWVEVEINGQTNHILMLITKLFGQVKLKRNNFGLSSHSIRVICLQPHSLALPSPERKTLVGSGHVVPRFWVLANKTNMAGVLKIDSCSYLALC